MSVGFLYVVLFNVKSNTIKSGEILLSNIHVILHFEAKQQEARSELGFNITLLSSK